MNDPLKVGLIGCGNVALDGHAPALRDLEGVEIVAIADPVEARRQKVQTLLALPDAACFDNHRSLLDIGLDYVALTVPQKFRRTIVEDCAQAGLHVISEKPIATVPADGQAMIDAMQAANLRFGIVHNYIYFPEYVLARRLITSGAIGRLRHVTLNFLGMPDHPGAAEYDPRWRHDANEAGGGILMDMIHAIYMTEYFLDQPIRAASAVVDNLDHPDASVEDFTLVHYYFESGYATVNMWWGGGVGGLELSGSDGRILVFYDDYSTGPFSTLASFTLVNGEGKQEFNPADEYSAGETFIERTNDTFSQVHADFAEAIRNERDPIAPAETGLRSLEATLAAYASAATGRVVSLPLSTDGPLFARGVAGLRELPLWADSPLRNQGVFGL